MGISFERIRGALNTSKLLEEINSQPTLWKDHEERQTFPGTAHSETETIYLRWANEFSFEAVFKSIEAVDYGALDLLPTAKELILKAIAAAEIKELGRVIITKLSPNGFIDPHTDDGVYADYFERFHIPLQSYDGNYFFVENKDAEGEFAYMKPGELWWFNHKKKHWVVNNSDHDRIHLIIDGTSSKYRDRVYAKTAN